METLNGLAYYSVELATSIGHWTLDHPEVMFFVILGILIFCLTWGFLVWWKHTRQERPEDREARLRRVIRLMAQRKAKLDEMYADMIGDMLFTLYHKGAISRNEYRRDSRRFGVKYKLLDLLPRRNKPEAIKARVVKNVEALRQDYAGMRLQLETIRSGGYAVLEAKVQAMPQPDPLHHKVKVYLVRGKTLGLKRA